MGLSLNPFNPVGLLRYQIDRVGETSVEAFDLSGRKVGDIYRGYQAPGEYSLAIDGRSWVSGIYVIRVTAGMELRTIKAVIVK